MKNLLFLRTLILLIMTFCYTSLVAQNNPIPPKNPVKLSEVKSQLSTDKLRVHFIDVGGGLAMFIQTPNGKTIFVDGGKGSNNDLDNVGLYVETFLPEGSVIDLAIVTHGDTDHFRGMAKIFENYEVKEFWYNGYISQKLNLELTQWNQFVLLVKKERGCDKKFILNKTYDLGDVIVFDDSETIETADDVTITLLNMDDNPPAIDRHSNRKFSESLQRNDASIVFKLAYGNTSFLITGDINGRKKSSSDDNLESKERELIDRANSLGDAFNLSSTVLQAAHHGSDGSSSTKFLEEVNPTYIVIPAGTEHGHPHREALLRMENNVGESFVLRTDEGEDESDSDEEPRMDDNLIFEVSTLKIEQIYRAKQDL